MKIFIIVKTISEFLIASIFIVILFPLLAAIALIIAFQFKEFPFFIQERGITLDKNIFKIIKFRTLKTIPLNKNSTLTGENILIKYTHVYRVTPFSAWLRKTGIDEIPQLINIISGQMSFIGPRPLMIKDLEILKLYYPQIYKLRENINSKPGISGMWQINKQRDFGPANMVVMELVYEKYHSLLLDFKLCIATISILFSGNNSDGIRLTN